MRTQWSHGRLFGIVLVLSFPVGLGMAAGYWISQKAQVKQQQVEERSHLQKVTSQSHLLFQMVSQEIESLRLQVLNQYYAANFTKNLEKSGSSVLFWAALGSQGQAWGPVLKKGQSPFWSVGADFEEAYLKNLTQTLNPDQIREKGMGLLRTKKDPQGVSEWLTLAFAGPDSSVLVALVDPAVAFASIQLWGSHSEAGRSRAFLVTQDGIVLAHSQKSWAFANLSSMPIFQGLVRKAWEGSVTGGSGGSVSIDQLPTYVAYSRLPQLPLAVVAEEVNTLELTKPDPVWVGGLFVVAAVALLVVVLGCALLLSSLFTRVVTLTAQPVASRRGVSQSMGEELEPLPDFNPNGTFFSDEDFLVVHPIERSDLGPSRRSH